MHSLDARTAGDRTVLALSGELTIYSAAELKARIEVLIPQGDLELDLSKVEEVDTAGLQLLLWLKGEARAHGRALVLAHHAPCVVEAMDLLGMAGLFDDPILIAPL